MSRAIRVVQFGVGPIGLACARTILDKQATGLVELVGVVDVDPAKAGQDIGVLVGQGRTGLLVSDDAEALLRTEKPAVVIHSTSSFLADVVDQLVMCARLGANVVSSTEELSFPDPEQADLTDRIHGACLEYGVTVLGTGVNPGYAMDALVVMATAPCVRVDHVDVERVVNAGLRRGPLQRKIGAGISPAEFEVRKATGRFGHIGLVQSVRLVTEALGLNGATITNTLEPVTAQRRIVTDVVDVQPGSVAGIHQVATAVSEAREMVRLDLTMAVGIERSFDRVRISGDPPIELMADGGIFGDTATVGTLVNSVPVVLAAAPGLARVIDLPVGRAFAAFPLAVARA